MRSLSLKIDVCTHQGMRHGVPRLLDLLLRHRISASFFLAFGPDNSGKAILNIFRPGFLRKMLRTSAPSVYGVRTMLSGTLLPAYRTADRYPELVRRIDAEGHEAALHGWDHRRWQDRLRRLDRARIRREYDRASSSFEEILGRRPTAWGAPAWLVTPESLAVQDEVGLAYASDLRGGPPCRLRCGETVFSTPQIPTTGPCIEELLAEGVSEEDALADALLGRAAGHEVSVLAVHAEVEGGPYLDFLDRLLPRLRETCDVLRPLGDVARDLGELPVRELVLDRLPGRSGEIATSR